LAGGGIINKSASLAALESFRFRAAKRINFMKVLLEQKPIKGYLPAGREEVNLTKSLPFYKSEQGKYVHRVRSGRMYFDYTCLSHTAVSLWCGGNGFIGKKGKLYEEPPNGFPLCATCEGRAIGAGQIGSHKILGRIVKFSPRRL